MNAGLRHWLRHTGVALGVAVTLTLGWAGYLRLSGNFHSVEDGVLYRSGQLSGMQLHDRITANGIRTVINFRGNNAGRPWYDAEMNVSAATGVRHIDFPISAGADRSGLASALYTFAVAKRPAVEAAAQLSFRYGHFPWLGSRTAAMDRTFDRVVERRTATPLLD